MINEEIKALISKHPKITDVLNIYEIDCVNCSIGTCKLKDIVKIHDLSFEQEEILFKNIEDISNEKEIDLSTIKYVKTDKKIIYSTAMQKLVDEHKKILRLLNLAEFVVNKKDLSEPNKSILKEIVYYVINYADKYHHAKEEDLLFKMVDENEVIIQAMNTEHVAGRNYISQAIKGIEENNVLLVNLSILSYINLLREHIRKEDKILYPWLDAILNKDQKNLLLSQYLKANENAELNLETKFESFLYKNYV